MKQIELAATSREILGKKVRFLRRQGITPVHIFGHGFESMALQCDTALLQKVLVQAGRTGLVSLKLGNKGPRNVLVREIQRNPVTTELLHVDFYEVRATERIKVNVPIVLIGEAPALKFKGSILVQELDHLSVECLPENIPASAELELSLLTGAEQALRVKDITLGEEVTVTNDPELVVAKISAQPVEVAEEEAAVVEAAAEAAEPAEAP